MSNYEPEIPGGNPLLTPQQVSDLLLDIAETNRVIRETLAGPEEGLRGYRQDSNIRQSYIQQLQVGDFSSPEEAFAASQQELERGRSEAIQRSIFRTRAAREAMALSRQYTQMSAREQFEFLGQRGFIREDPRSGELRTVAGGFPASDVQEALEAQAAGTTTPRQENILNKISTSLVAHIEAEIAAQAPSRTERLFDAIEESGLRQLRYGQLPLQDILRSAGTLAGRLYQRRQTEYLAATERVRRAREMGYEPEPIDVRNAERLRLAQEAGDVGMLGGGPMGRWGMRGAARLAQFLPTAGQFLGVAEVVRDIFQNQIMGRIQGTTRTGQITGGGFGEGLRARWQAFTLGLSPIDMITGQQAQEIVQGTRQRGFRGRQAEEIQRAVADTVADLGITIESSINLYTDAIRLQGETVDEVRERLEDFDDAAREAGVSVQEFTDRFIQIQQQVGAAGAGQASGVVAGALTRATPAGVDAGLYGQVFERARGEIAASMGVPINMLTSQQYAQAAYGPGLEQAIERQQRLAASLVGDDPNAIATWLANSSPYFQGMDVRQIQRILDQINNQRGPSAQMNFEREGRRAMRAEVQAGRRMGRQTIRMEDVQARIRGVDRDDWRDFLEREYGIKGDTEYQRFIDAFREQGGRGEYTVEGGRAFLPRDELERIRRQSLDRLRPDLRQEDIAHFERNIRNRQFNVQHFIDRIRDEKGRRSGPEVDLANNFGSVTIRLRPGMESKLFELARERETEAARGNFPRNQQPRP